MSINDPYKVEIWKRTGNYIIVQGRETLYDESRQIRQWATLDELLKWANEHNIHIDLSEDTE